MPNSAPEHLASLSGIELSDIVFKELAFFRENPENEIFRKLKTDAYFKALEKDIREAGAIVTPLIAMPDGLLLEGESRLRVAKSLVQKGLNTYKKVPARIVRSLMSTEEIRSRLYLGNLSRFEIDEDTRILLYAQIWPGYFSASVSTGRPKADTVSPFAIRQAEIAEVMGKSERQLRRDRTLYQKALAIARSQGKLLPEKKDIEEAKNDRKQKREPGTRTNLNQTRRLGTGKTVITDILNKLIAATESDIAAKKQIQENRIRLAALMEVRDLLLSKCN